MRATRRLRYYEDLMGGSLPGVRFQFRCAARPVPDARDGNGFILLVHVVNDAIRAKDDLANRLLVQFRNDAPHQRELRERIDLCDEPDGELAGGWRIMRQDELDDISEIIAGLMRPDYFVSHEAS